MLHFVDKMDVFFGDATEESDFCVLPWSQLIFLAQDYEKRVFYFWVIGGYWEEVAKWD